MYNLDPIGLGGLGDGEKGKKGVRRRRAGRGGGTEVSDPRLDPPSSEGGRILLGGEISTMMGVKERYESIQQCRTIDPAAGPATATPSSVLELVGVGRARMERGSSNTATDSADLPSLRSSRVPARLAELKS